MRPMNFDPAEKLSESEIEDTWSVLSADERAEAFCLLGREEAQDFFLKISVDDRAQIIRRLPEGEKRLWLRLLAPDDSADLIQHSPDEERSMLLNLLDDQNRREVNVLLTYKQDVAGGLMNPHFARVPPDLTADEAIRYLR
ncbi:MAG TPA: magnesium transporter, partial [Candidatus Omnitrophica bacterium]|nr:magnesium transporter [Candidatus Omnitrophota bacterium]